MQEDWMEDPFYQLFWTIINLMMYTNHVINFLSYCMTGTKFRRELIRLFVPKSVATRYLNIKPNHHTIVNLNNKLIVINKKKNQEQANNGMIKIKRKNLKVSFEDISKQNDSVAVNNAKADLNEIDFILTRIKDVESNNSFESDMSNMKNTSRRNSNRTSMTKKISLKLKNISKRKSTLSDSNEPC